ncbi:helix-turn-helix domain-containing protein [Herbiconiux moechotypicola]|uniref:IclR family transcriptional regulator domain-containing protein n=1 Tax=Herbiconiux moechotypicola TaxID=637393 RepID=UPI00217D8152|nr:IclR family transcriptional regulator C-terminal domain-containing protein [Herbiconiux moechotypicola]MCS5729245.1 helix-turn-helix domain-containing protein [Herbiconiux moechotypicola]
MEGREEFVQSLARGLRVLTAFTAESREQTLSDVARASGLTRATSRRLLHTLVELGYVRTDGKLFALTPRVLELGYGFLSGLSLPEVAQPHLERLSRDLGESTSASVLDGADIVYVARVPARRIMTVAITIGTRFPAYATSMGRVLLAGLPPAALDEALAGLPEQGPTAATVTDADALRTEIAVTRERGWALVDQELENGLRSLAAPVRRGGRVVAAINVSTAAATTPLERLTGDFVPPLLAAATAISTELDLVR